MIAYLKIKVVSLAAEAALIHYAERKLKRRIRKRGGNLLDNSKASQTWWGLNSHRRNEVRSEARSANLAYGFIRGRAYKALEQKCYKKPDWARVAKIAAKYGDPKTTEKIIGEWAA